VELKDINKLIDKITEKGITEFQMEQDGLRLQIVKKAPEIVKTEVVQAAHAGSAAQEANPAAQPSAAPAEPAAEPDDDSHKLVSPMVGTFYEAPSPGAKPYVKVGDTVKKGQVCCIVEAMKIMNEIQADVDGEIIKIHVENEQPVEFNEPIFSIKAD